MIWQLWLWNKHFETNIYLFLVRPNHLALADAPSFPSTPPEFQESELITLSSSAYSCTSPGESTSSSSSSSAASAAACHKLLRGEGVVISRTIGHFGHGRRRNILNKDFVISVTVVAASISWHRCRVCYLIWIFMFVLWSYWIYGGFLLSRPPTINLSIRLKSKTVLAAALASDRVMSAPSWIDFCKRITPELQHHFVTKSCKIF